MNRRLFLKALALSLLLVIIGCKDDNAKFGELLFYPQEKVCYIDDPNLIGRVLGRNGFGKYWVQWRTPSQSSGFFGGIHNSAFTKRTHNSWELKSLK